MRRIPRLRFRFAFALLLFLAGAAPVRAQDQLCDPGNEDCRAILIGYIRNETVAIDVAFWFMEDARYTNELILKWRAGVPVRVLIDPRANSDYPLNAQRLAELQAAGIPMRKRLTSNILHWKMMLFHGQNVVQFSGANYSADAWRPGTATAYENFVDEAIYFTNDTSIVNSFRTRFDDQWVDTTNWSNYANVAGSLTRRYGIFSKDSRLNFVPWENYRTRSVGAYNAERRKIDVIMYRITDRAHTDGILAAVSRGIAVRLITEPEQYRDPSRMWHAWNVDRLHMGGVQIKHRAHQGLNHQKSVILYDQNGGSPGDQPMVIFGSSNWTSPSAAGQVEHNMFTSRPNVTSWFINQFERKWNNSGGIVENLDFVPLPPDAPKNPVPASGATDIGRTVTLKWYGGPWAHLYDVYLDTNPNPTTPIAVNLAESSKKTATSTFSFSFPNVLRPGTRYYWKVVGKTIAMQSRSSAVWSFTTAGLGGASDVDFDGRADLTVYRPSTGEWFVRTSTTRYSYSTYQKYQWGLPGDYPAGGDFDADGRLDLVVFRPSTGQWYLRYSSKGYDYAYDVVQWGVSGDVPFARDFDGDARSDLVVYRPSTGEWFIRTSLSAYTAYSLYQWGLSTDIPVPADFDGDGRCDLAVFRHSTGEWFIRFSSSNYSNYAVYQWGLDGDIPLVSDFDGDGKTDLAVFRPSDGSWYIRFSSTNYGNWATYRWGLPGDVPVAADFDGDARADLVVFRPSTGEWYIRYSSSGYTSAYAIYQWGLSGDVPIAPQIR